MAKRFRCRIQSTKPQIHYRVCDMVKKLFRRTDFLPSLGCELDDEPDTCSYNRQGTPPWHYSSS